MNLVKRLGADLFTVLPYHPCRNSDDGGIRRNLLKHDRSCRNSGIIAYFKGPQDLGSRAYHNIVSYGGMPFTYILAGTAERYALINKHIVADFGRFSYNYAGAVVYNQSAADFCARVNFYSGFSYSALRNITR